jgi:hypothetical protein
MNSERPASAAEVNHGGDGPQRLKPNQNTARFGTVETVPLRISATLFQTVTLRRCPPICKPEEFGSIIAKSISVGRKTALC